ncbi:MULTISPECIES: PgaD family protein [unclassified Halomonas]|uniref:PgaD family protein n=1 Tax=unclassified Halomonas TaxID=2609666 RepID=UPI0021E40CFF|nr:MULTISPECIES: PgaD family protein [unclassified Halomonas]UYG01361.1 PgaD family protein [Halomonas sp. GD1P12]WNL37582.1 PgaD family protein [Halomonas sp. PAMB 3232]WNL40896.1 PgaD family protein [Halomonas sp. PAMB 3264]
MSNKLMPVIIDNPCQKCWQYRTRDTVMALATLGLWLVVLSRLHTFYTVEDAIIEQLYSSTMLQLLAAGFIVTFLTFHLWAVYNRYLYKNLLRRAERVAAIPLIENEYAAPFSTDMGTIFQPEKEVVR